MKRKFKQLLSTIPPISTKQKNTSRLMNIIKDDNLLYDVKNPGLGHNKTVVRLNQ
jgi:hypothetical protein